MTGQHKLAGVLGSILIARGLLGFIASPERLFGVFSTTMNHNLLHILVGGAYIWVVLAADTRQCARKWNKFLGWIYLIISILGIFDPLWIADNLGRNTLADNVFNVGIAMTSILLAHHGEKVKKKGVGFMKVLGFPFGKS